MTDEQARLREALKLVAVRLKEGEVPFALAGGYAETVIYDRYALKTGNRVIGPAIIEELDSSVVVHPGFVAEAGHELQHVDDRSVRRELGSLRHVSEQPPRGDLLGPCRGQQPARQRGPDLRG